jgi:hypothetical protein
MRSHSVNPLLKISPPGASYRKHVHQPNPASLLFQRKETHARIAHDPIIELDRLTGEHHAHA